MLDITDFHVWFLVLKTIIESNFIITLFITLLNKPTKYVYFISLRDIFCLFIQMLHETIVKIFHFQRMFHHHGRLILPLIQNLPSNLQNTFIRKMTMTH